MIDERAAIVEATLTTARQRAGWWRARCPFCEERDTSFSYNPETGFWHCFRCREKGTLGDVPEALLGGGLTKQDESELARARRPPESFTLLADDDSDTLAHARAYLEERKIPEHVQRAAQVGACFEGVYADRIVIPNLQLDGSWLGYTTRLIGKRVDKRAKYRYPPGPWRSAVLHNEAALYERTQEACYVVEGAFDVLALWPHAVALLGSSGPFAASDQQLAMLREASRPLVVVLDGDAWETGWSLAMRLRMLGCIAGAVRLAPGLDPDEVDPATLWEEGRAALGSL